MKNLRIAALFIAASLALTGCASASTETSTGTESNGQSHSETQNTSGKLQIVASTNIWGDIASTVGGELVEVTSIINTSSQDPHSYEASARDQLAFNKADLIITNGGGYDDFADKLAEGAGDAAELKMADAITNTDAAQNEHLWYSISAVGEATYAIADELGKIDAANAETYLTNADSFIESLTGIAASYTEVRKGTDGLNYFATEPLAFWLLRDLGLTDKTPAEFSKAIENETDVAPLVMNKSLELIKSGKIDVLVVNAQTENTQTEQLTKQAKASGVTVITLGELMPKGMNYLDWMGQNVMALDAIGE
jgi:zinc/manganese transport system substrate-binding protein